MTHGHADMTAIAPHEKRPTNVKKRPIIPLAYLKFTMCITQTYVRFSLSLPPSLPLPLSLARALSLYNHLYCQHLGRWSGFDPPYLDRPGRQLHQQRLSTTLHRGQRRLHWSVVVLRGRAGKAFSSGDRCTITCCKDCGGVARSCGSVCNKQINSPHTGTRTTHTHTHTYTHTLYAYSETTRKICTHTHTHTHTHIYIHIV